MIHNYCDFTTTLYHIQCICRHNVYLRRLEAFTWAFAGATKIIYANHSSEEGSAPISVKRRCFVIENHEISLVKVACIKLLLIYFTLKLEGFYKTKYIAVMLTWSAIWISSNPQQSPLFFLATIESTQQMNAIIIILCNA